MTNENILQVLEPYFINDLETIHTFIKYSPKKNTKKQIFTCIKHAMTEILSLNYDEDIINKTINSQNDELITLLRHEQYSTFVNKLGNDYINHIMYKTCNIISTTQELYKIYPNLNTNILNHYIEYVDIKVKELITNNINTYDAIYKYFSNEDNIQKFILSLNMYKIDKFFIYDQEITNKINVLINLPWQENFKIIKNAFKNVPIYKVKDQCLHKLEQNKEMINKQINTWKIINNQLTDINNQLIDNCIGIEYQFFAELHHKNNFIPLVYVNGNIIESHIKNLKNNRQSHIRLLNQYCTHMSLHENDIIKQPKRYWTKIKINLKYNNDIAEDFLQNMTARAVYNQKLLILLYTNPKIKTSVINTFKQHYSNIQILSLSDDAQKLIFE